MLGIWLLQNWIKHDANGQGQKHGTAYIYSFQLRGGFRVFCHTDREASLFHMSFRQGKGLVIVSHVMLIERGIVRGPTKANPHMETLRSPAPPAHSLA